MNIRFLIITRMSNPLRLFESYVLLNGKYSWNNVDQHTVGHTKHEYWKSFLFVWNKTYHGIACEMFSQGKMGQRPTSKRMNSPSPASDPTPRERSYFYDSAPAATLAARI